MHVDRVDLSAIQPMDVGATLPSDGCPQLRERHSPFHSTPPLVGSKRGIRNEHGRLDFRPFLNERGFREDKRSKVQTAMFIPNTSLAANQGRRGMKRAVSLT